MSTPSERWRLSVDVTGAEKIVLKQQAKAWWASRNRWDRRYLTIETCAGSHCVERLSKGTQSWGGRVYRWQDKVRITATFPGGATRTWGFRMRSHRSRTLTCPTCLPVPVIEGLDLGGNGIRKDTPSIYRTGTGDYSPGFTFSSKFDDIAIAHMGDETVVTDTETGEKKYEVITVDGIQAPHPDADIKETIDTAEEELDALMDEDKIIEIPSETVELLDSVTEVMPPPMRPQMLPQMGLSNELVYTGAGAAVGAVAGNLLADNPLLGAVAGGVAGWFFGREA